jgi:cysteine desulfurase
VQAEDQTTSGETAQDGQSPIYLDYNASAPLRPEALASMLVALGSPGNAASAHRPGQRTAVAVDRARRQVADLLGCTAQELVLTSGATEANNLALRTTASVDGRVVVSAVEHPAVLEAARALTEQTGCELVIIGVDDDGLLLLDDLRRVLADRRPTVVSVMAANNETGALSDLDAVGQLTSEAGAILHTDATQLVGRLPMVLADLPVDLLSLSAHKFGGPQGVGALFIRRGVVIRQRPLLVGGGQERGWRAGTLNVAGIVGMGAAAAAAVANMDQERKRVGQLRDRLETEVLVRVPNVRRNGHLRRRLPGVSSLTFAGAPADAVLAAMPEVAASDGSACSSGALSPSHVLLAMHRSAEEADSTVRFSLGHATTSDEIDRAIDHITSAVATVRRATGGPSSTGQYTSADEMTRSLIRARG